MQSLLISLILNLEVLSKISMRSAKVPRPIMKVWFISIRGVPLKPIEPIRTPTRTKSKGLGSLRDFASKEHNMPIRRMIAICVKIIKGSIPTPLFQQ
jgi:hypothetical protein